MSINDHLFNPVVTDAQRIKAHSSLLDTARTLYAMTGGRLMVNYVPSERYIVMGTAYGMNLIYLTFKDVRGGTGTAIYSVHYNWGSIRSNTEVAISKKLAYLKRRFKMSDVYDQIMDPAHGVCTETGMAYRMANILREACRCYIAHLTSAAKVDIGARVSFTSRVDEWLMRYYAGLSTRSEMPSDVLVQIDEALSRYQGKLDFLNRAEDLIKAMFDREKWMLIPQDHGVTVVGLDTRALVGRLKESMINGGDVMRLVPGYGDKGQSYFSFTYQPKFFRTVDGIEDEAVRSSILSSMAMVRPSRAQLFPNAARTRDEGGLFTKAPDFKMSNEAGWMEEVEYYGNEPSVHYLIVDKD